MVKAAVKDRISYEDLLHDQFKAPAIKTLQGNYRDRLGGGPIKLNGENRFMTDMAIRISRKTNASSRICPGTTRK